MRRSASASRFRGPFVFLLLALALMFGFALWRFDLVVGQARLDRQLIEAVKRKDRIEVIALLRHGANPSTRDLPQPGSLFDSLKRLFHRSSELHTEDFPTALLIALRTGDLPLAEVLIEAKADLNATDKQRITPLALTFSRPEEYDNNRDWEQEAGHFADRLLDNGANPNTHDTEGTPALILAVQKSDPSDRSGRLFQMIVRKMIRKGADLSAHDAAGKTALLWSAWAAFNQEKRESFPEAMRLLLESGADPRPPKNAGWSILNWAAFFGDIKLAQALLAKGLTVNTPDENGRTALHVAISQRKADFVRFLLKQSANVNAADHFGMTPLMFAAQTDDAETCRLLLRQGASRKSKEKDHGWTAEQLARYLHAERFLTLLKTGNVVPAVSSRAPSANRVQLDANRWLVVRRAPKGGIQHYYLLKLVSRDGRQSEVDTLSSFSPLKINVFQDGDGSPVAFVRWSEQGGGASLYRFEGMRAKEVWSEGTRYGSDFRPLKEGGCLVWTWRPAFQEIGGESPRANDDMCLPFYYRNGKCAELEGICFPGCLKQM